MSVTERVYSAPISPLWTPYDLAAGAAFEVRNLIGGDDCLSRIDDGVTGLQLQFDALSPTGTAHAAHRYEYSVSGYFAPTVGLDWHGIVEQVTLGVRAKQTAGKTQGGGFSLIFPLSSNTTFTPPNPSPTGWAGVGDGAWHTYTAPLTQIPIVGVSLTNGIITHTLMGGSAMWAGGGNPLDCLIDAIWLDVTYSNPDDPTYGTGSAKPWFTGPSDNRPPLRQLQNVTYPPLRQLQNGAR